MLNVECVCHSTLNIQHSTFPSSHLSHSIAFQDRRPPLELRIGDQRKATEVLIKLDRSRADLRAVLDRSLEVFWCSRTGLELDRSAHLLHLGIDGKHCLCGRRREIVVVED